MSHPRLFRFLHAMRRFPAGFRALPGLLLPLALVSLAAAAPKAKTRPGTAPKREPEKAVAVETGPRLDSARVHQLYMNGDFEEAITLLEANLKETRAYRHDDSVFIFKHLGVMYAAEERTREKGRYYMYRLLTTEPTAKILDMYASDMIYMIFRNIQEEFEATRARKVHADTTLGRNLASEPKREARPERTSADPELKSSSKGIWLGATAAVVVAAGAASWYILANEEPKTSAKNFRPQ